MISTIPHVFFFYICLEYSYYKQLKEVDIQLSRSGEVKMILKITLMSLSVFKDVLSAHPQMKHEDQVWPPTKSIPHCVTSLAAKVRGPFWQGHKAGKEQSGAFQIRNLTHLHRIWGQGRKKTRFMRPWSRPEGLQMGCIIPTGQDSKAWSHHETQGLT